MSHRRAPVSLWRRGGNGRGRAGNGLAGERSASSESTGRARFGLEGRESFSFHYQESPAHQVSEGEEGGEGGSGEPWQCHEERMGVEGEGGGGGGTRPLADTRTLVYEVGKRKKKGFFANHGFT